MKILYFAWLKEHTGQASENMQLPDGVDTVGGLIPYITKQSAGHKTALKNLDAVRVAVKAGVRGVCSGVRDDPTRAHGVCTANRPVTPSLASAVA